ncbi:MAG: winged helix-turn-helix domain-containing protein [Candidatus Thorarchaeota archaeon]|nr:winged helix-turn-helix domain-containing protein [Candidatus Thorarchaeota archaeon]
MSKKRPYRSKMRILADMMRAIQSEGEEGAGPTKILYSANLSHDRLTQYLDELVEKELIKEMDPESNNRSYLLTEKGREFLREFVRMERFSEAFGIEI